MDEHRLSKPNVPGYKVHPLEAKLNITTNLLKSTQQQLDGDKKDIKDNVTILGKLDRKYKQDEEEVKRRSLILDGVNERDNRRPRLVVNNLFKDLNLDLKEQTLKLPIDWDLYAME